MGLGSRTARLHATARAVEAFNQAEGSTWDFQPGERVMTVDGFPGIVAAVHDGPFQGNEEYEVTLDGGLGGGAYTASQLRPVSGGAQATVHTAADDYPELGSILTERPDIAINTVLGSLNKHAHTESYREDCPGCHVTEQGYVNNPNDVAHGLPTQPQHIIEPWEGWKKDSSLHTAAEQTTEGLAPEQAGEGDYSDGDTCPSCGGHRMLNSSDGTKKCENCGYLESGDAQTGGEAKTAQVGEPSKPTNPFPNGAACKDCGFAKYDAKAGESCPLCDGQMAKHPEKYAAKSWDLIVHAAEDPSFLRAVTATWADVKSKAKRLRQEDGVKITAVEGGQVIAHVEGDHGTYETVLQHHLGSHQAVSAWNCGCAWARYAWGRSGSYKRYEGRMCSHALATQLEALARGVFGDAHPENFGARMAALSPQESPVAFLVQSSLAAGDEPAEVVLALRTAGITNAQAYVHLAASGDPSGMSAGEGLGSTEPASTTLGPTHRRSPYENPASAGWASGSDPENWAQDSSAFGRMGSLHDEAWDEPEMQKEALPAAVIPLVRAVAPQVGKAVVKHVVKDMLDGSDKQEAKQGQTPQQQAAPIGFNHPEGSSWGTQAELNDIPEAALPVTDGAEIDMDPVDFDPDLGGLAAHGSAQDESVDDIVAQFQATAGKTLMESGPKGGDDGGMNVALAAKMALKDFSAAEQADLINEGATEGVTASNLDRLDIAGTHYEALEAALASRDDDDDLDF